MNHERRHPHPDRINYCPHPVHHWLGVLALAGGAAMTEPLIKLKPCPFCGANEPTLRQGIDGGAFWVMCESCFGEGSVDLGNSGACEAWNTRPIEAQLLEACKMLVSAYGIYQTEPAYAIGMKAIAAAEGEK